MIGYLESGEPGNGEIFTILKKLQNALSEYTKLTAQKAQYTFHHDYNFVNEPQCFSTLNVGKVKYFHNSETALVDEHKVIENFCYTAFKAK